MKTYVLGLFIALAIACSLQAAPSPKLFVTGSGNAPAFRSFEDDAGGFYLVWVNADQPKSIALRAQHMNADGQPVWDAAGLVVSSRLVSPEDWSGLADGKGGLTLFWDERDGVYAQRFLPDGTRRREGNAVQMSTNTAVQPDAVPDAAGGTLVVWREMLSTGRSVLRAQRLDTDGQPVWQEGGMRVTLSASHQTNPRVIYDNMSGMIIAWRDEVNNASEMRVQRMDFQGNRLWTQQGIKVTAPLGVSEFPRIAPLGTGEVVLAWNGSSSQTNQIYLQKVGPDPKLKWGDMALASNVPILYNRWNPILVGDDDGGTWIGWEDFRDQLNYQIQVNHLQKDGRSQWPRGEIAVAPAAGDQGKLAMSGDGNNGVWLAWVDNRLSTIGIYAQQVDQNGILLQGKQGRLIADHLSKPSLPQLVAIAPNKAIVAWTNRPKKDQWELFWSKVETPFARP